MATTGSPTCGMCGESTRPDKDSHGLPVWCCDRCGLALPRRGAQPKLPGLDRGRQSRALPCAHEDVEQARLFDEIRRHEREVWELTLCLHVPNGGYRRPREAARFQALGVRPGVPDVLLPVPRGEFCGLAVELKRERGGHLEEAQAEWRDMLRWAGWRAEVCRGWRPAWAAIVDYLALTHSASRLRYRL